MDIDWCLSESPLQVVSHLSLPLPKVLELRQTKNTGNGLDPVPTHPRPSLLSQCIEATPWQVTSTCHDSIFDEQSHSSPTSGDTVTSPIRTLRSMRSPIQSTLDPITSQILNLHWTLLNVHD